MNENQLFSYLNIGLPEDILRLKLYGDFDGAIQLIDHKLSDSRTPESLRYCLLAEREMIKRLPSDFPFTREEALTKIRSYIPDFTDEEFEEHLASGQIRWIFVNGSMRIFDRFFESMCKSMPEFAKRANLALGGVESAGKGSEGDLRLNRTMKIMKEQGSMANRIRIHASVRVNDSEFTPGMFVRVHLPLPAACEQQSQIVVESIYPENRIIAPENAPQRTICWEEHMQENHEFQVTYSYVHTARWHDTDAMERELALNPLCAGTSSDIPPMHSDACADVLSDELEEATKELAPHIVFTPYIRALVAELSKGCRSPLEQARRFYDFITLNFKYTYMPSYFSMESIPETCARSFTGDCGVFALLFLTMCRCAGIPAKWQSGLTAEPDFIGGHDWVRFYVAPFGWLYADTSYGIGAVRAENEERRRFYFGNLDPYRMVANSEFQAPFTIEKAYFRTDPYDNQLGEIETDTRGLRYEEFTRSKEILLCEEVF